MKKDFYIYKCLREIHRINQLDLLNKKSHDILLILNTPGSLEHFMVHTEPDNLQKIFDKLLSHVIKAIGKGSIEFGYKLGRDDHLSFYVKEPLKQVMSQSRFENRFKAEAELLSEITDQLSECGGRIWIENSPESGKTFWFSIEIQAAGAVGEEKINGPESLKFPDWSARTILIVDDVHTNLILLENTLKPTRASVISVDNGLKAVNAVKKNDSINFVLMDVRMPVLDGYEATRRIKRIKPWLPVVAISAYGSSAESKKWQAAGCDSFLGKPLKSEELIHTMITLFKNVPTEV